MLTHSTADPTNPRLPSMSALAKQPACIWTDLPRDCRIDIVEQISPAGAAALAATCRHNNRLVERQPHLHALLLGAAQGPLPKYPHATLHRLVAPYGGLAAAMPLVEQTHMRREVLSDDALFGAALDAWADQEMAAGAPEDTIRAAACRVYEVKQDVSFDLDLSELPIKMLPPLTRLTTLKSLKLAGCQELTSLPEWLGNLVTLEALNLDGCNHIASLLDSLGNLVALETLSLFACTSLSSLPDSLGNLVTLKRLKLTCGLSLSSLPDSLGNLVALQTLHLNGCESLSSLPNSLGNLIALEKLFVSNCTSLSSMPDSLGDLTALKWLMLDGCTSLSSLPDSLGNLIALEVLCLSDCASLHSLPNSLGNLAVLKSVELDDCTSLPPASIEAAQISLPGCKIYH